MKNYILVSTLRNEAENLPKLLESVAIQTITPAIWVIMNDNSTDNTEEIIRDAIHMQPYIHLINLNPGERDLAWRYHRNMAFGFKKAIEIAEQDNIQWNSIGILDGDIYYEDPQYYEKLLQQLEDDSTLGIISGALKEPINGEFKTQHQKNYIPWGACRLISAECYSKTGYPIEPAADSIMRILAKNHGYTTEIISTTYAYQSRPTTSISTNINDAKYVAYVKYYLGFPVTYFIITTLRIILKGKPKNAFAFFSTYFKHSCKNKPKIKNATVRKAYSTAHFGVKI